MWNVIIPTVLCALYFKTKNDHHPSLQVYFREGAEYFLKIQIAKFDHITPALIDLHWLPVTFRVQFKLLLLVYKSLHNQSPSYITDLLSVKPAANYALRSSAKSLLLVPKVNCSTLRDWAFAHAALVLWNSLSVTIRSRSSLAIFKKQLKMILCYKKIRERRKCVQGGWASQTLKIHDRHLMYTNVNVQLF